MSTIKRIIRVLEQYLDNISIKKKFMQIYIFCVLVPLIITDSVVLYIAGSMESQRQAHEMANIASTVSYNISTLVENAGEIAKSMYTNKRVDSFLAKQYESTSDYYAEYQKFFQDSTLENVLGMNQILFTMYTDNPTVIKGGKIDNMSNLKKTAVYEAWKNRGENEGLFFVYESKGYANSYRRKVILLQNLDFFSQDQEKMLKIEFDYNSMMRMLRKMNYDNEILICQGDEIVLSNGSFSGVGKNFDRITVQQKMGYKQSFVLHGAQLDIYVLKREHGIWERIARALPLLGFLVIINVVLPMGFVLLLNHSFTKRVRGLSKVFQSVNGEYLVQMAHEEGRDEIGSMIRNYNRMVRRTNELIQTVYKNKIKEQEILVGRKNAELLALQSQINPHFLFNALESIRMRSLLKKENETADMVEKLAIMQRQYVDWGNDSVRIEQELEFVKAYLSLQKYRFGERLNYQLDIDPECEQIRIPKLTIVTFVENACVHGIESKASPGWIFVRVYKRDEQLWVEIEDTGSGIEEQKLQLLQKNMQNVDIEMLKNKKSVGMLNACLRLKMCTENHVNFEIEGEEGAGTWITIRIPMEYL
ncbi:sensor histidine kinase [uncultured Eubacterium sp.]|uniref:sensor histidine kinase n=1 Tax=uncultured Eubacterium sp. TaxID=165185 RepID=UPI0032664343